MIKHILQLIWNRKRRNLLLFSEIFFGFIVVFIVASFCIKNFRAYLSPFGYETENLWIVRNSATRLLDSTDFVQAQEVFKREILQLEGVEAATFAGYAVPFTGSMWTNGGDRNGFEMSTSMIGGDKDYGKTLDIELSQGRHFNESDYTAKYPPVIINTKVLEQFEGVESLIDSFIFIGDKEYKVVGIAANIRYRDGFQEEVPTSVLLTPIGDKRSEDMVIRVAPGSGPELELAIGKVISSTLKTEDFNIVSMHANRLRIARRTWIPITVFLVIGSFLILNIALGLFGVLFYTIAKRKGEIGLRRAMGAYRSEIIQQFTLEVYFVALAAMILGAILAIQVPALGLIADDDFAYSNFYWAIFFAFTLISVVVLLCAFWPSRQGANLHPALALHEE